jgi:O-antigen/teichoic acid export membrane protein
MILARILNVGNFGIYGVMVSLISTVNIVFINGFKQAVSKFVSEEGCLSSKEKLFMFGLIFLAGLVIWAILFIGAEFVALLLNDISLVPIIQVVSFLVITYSIHTFFMGYINGLRRFKYEAGLRALYGVAKAGFIVGLAALTLNVIYAFWGFVAASVLIVFAGALVYKKLSSKNSKQRLRPSTPLKFFKFALPLMGFVLVTNIVLSLDLLMVKALLPIEIANTQSAYYTVASTISKLPFYAILALTSVLLPVISHWSHRERLDKVRFYISEANRYTIMLIALPVVAVSATAKPLVELLFKAAYAPAALPLSILIFGISFFALFSVLSSIVAGHNKPSVVAIVSFLALVLDFWLNLVLIPAHGLVGAAFASTAAMLFGLILLSGYVLFSFKALCSIKSFARILLAAAVAYVAALTLPFTGYALILTYIIVSVLYAIVLFLSRELGAKDFNLVREIIF